MSLHTSHTNKHEVVDPPTPLSEAGTNIPLAPHTFSDHVTMETQLLSEVRNCIICNI